MVSLVNSTKHLKKKQHQFFSDFSQKIEEEILQNSLYGLLPWNQSQTKTPQEKKTTGQHPWCTRM